MSDRITEYLEAVKRDTVTVGGLATWIVHGPRLLAMLREATQAVQHLHGIVTRPMPSTFDVSSFRELHQKRNTGIRITSLTLARLTTLAEEGMKDA